MDLGTWPETWERHILVQCLSCWPSPAFEELWNHKEALYHWLNSMLRDISYQKCDICRFMIFNLQWLVWLAYRYNAENRPLIIFSNLMFYVKILVLIPRIKVNTLETLQCACILFFSSFFLHWIYSQCPLSTSSSTFHSVNNVRWTLRLSFIFINIIYQN